MVAGWMAGLALFGMQEAGNASEIMGGAPTTIPWRNGDPRLKKKADEAPGILVISEVARAGITSDMFKRAVPPRASLPALFSTDDYPVEAMRQEAEGSVGVVLRVSVGGGVTDCIVEKSSGWPSLDWQTCRILWARARFTPARDGKGRAVESATRSTIRWLLPDDDEGSENSPTAPWSTRVAMTLLRDLGGECVVTTLGAQSDDGDLCAAYVEAVDRLLADAKGGERKPGKRLIADIMFRRIGDKPVALPAVAGVSVRARQRVSLSIAPDGKPDKCTVVEQSGAPTAFRGCDDLLAGRYQAAEDGSAINAEVIRTIMVSD